MNTTAIPPTMWRLTLARATAWMLLLAGWVGLGSFALVLAPGLASGFALIALWLLALGAAATVATRDGQRAWARRAALIVSAALAAAALLAAPRGGGLPALLLALLAWAALTALASGVVRSVRLAQPVPPGPPIGAASLGALVAGVVLADLGDLQGLALRLGALVWVAAVVLALLQPRDRAAESASRCRAGLFDCSLPAWPQGAWRDALQWPTLLAGLAMLPMMAALPLMVAWCRSQALAPQAIVALHLAAMFGPALLLRHVIARWSARQLAAVCCLCLLAGAAMALWATAPLDLLGLAFAHGTAWGLAWAGQLWAPGRRSRQGASPLRAAIGYAVLTLAFGWVVARVGAPGVAATHALLALAACAAWLFSASARAGALAAAAHTHEPAAARPDRHADAL
jgi:hypothetical protein